MLQFKNIKTRRHVSTDRKSLQSTSALSLEKQEHRIFANSGHKTFYKNQYESSFEQETIRPIFAQKTIRSYFFK